MSAHDDDHRCDGMTETGGQCVANAERGSLLCAYHHAQAVGGEFRLGIEAGWPGVEAAVLELIRACNREEHP